MPLCDATLKVLLKQGLLIAPEHQDLSLVNPASIDIRIGRRLLREVCSCLYSHPYESSHKSEVEWTPETLTDDPKKPYWLEPGEFALVESLERFRIPNGYSMHLYLKSSTARRGFDHSLAFWFDPGWDGIGTLEIENKCRYHALPLYTGMRIGQIVIDANDFRSDNPYSGRYQGAVGVEPSKPEPVPAPWPPRHLK